MSAAPWITDNAAALPGARTRRKRTLGAATTVPRASLFRHAMAHLAGFVVLTAVCYGFLSLMGHSLAASAMKQRSNAEVRAKSARSDVLELGRQVTGLVSVESLDRWATMHGFSRAAEPGTVENAPPN